MILTNFECFAITYLIVFNNTKNYSIFKSFFSNLIQNLISSLPPSPNAFTESKVASYYDNIKFLNFKLKELKF